MKRRDFCRLSLITGAAAAVPASRLIAASEASSQPGSTELRAVKLSGAENEAARRVWNGMIDKHPALIARCADTADVVRAVTFARERELLLAVRGGGHSFPGYSTCDGGLVIDLSPMRSVVVHAELITRAPRELSVDLSLKTNEDGTPGAKIYVVYSGDARSGAKVLEPLQRFGKPIRNTIGPHSYLEVQTWFDPPPIDPTHWYLKGGFVREYSPGLIAFLADEFRPDAGTDMYFQSANGAVADVPQTATAFSHRGAIANMMLFGVWKDASQDEAGRKAIRATWSKLAPFTDGYYVNLVDTDARDKGVDSNYGANFTRLATVKKQFDPMNLFHLNANSKPA